MRRRYAHLPVGCQGGNSLSLIALLRKPGFWFVSLIDKVVPDFENPHEAREVEEMKSPESEKRQHLMRIGLFSALAEPLGAALGFFLLLPFMNELVFGVLFA